MLLYGRRNVYANFTLIKLNVKVFDSRMARLNVTKLALDKYYVNTLYDNIEIQSILVIHVVNSRQWKSARPLSGFYHIDADFCLQKCISSQKNLQHFRAI